MMINKKIYIVIKEIAGLFFCLGCFYCLAPEFVGRYYLFVILFFIFLFGGLAHYWQLQRNLKKELAQKEEKIVRRQKELQKDLNKTMTELVTMQSEILDQYQKVDDLVKK